MILPNAMFILSRSAYDAVYAPQAAADIGRRVNVLAPPHTRLTIKEHTELLADMEILFSGWGGPLIDEAFLKAAPKLKAIFYGAGSISGFATPAMWERGIVVTTARYANSIPAAEFTVGAILLSLKHTWRLAAAPVNQLGFQIRPELPGNYGAIIGLVGMGVIARLVVRMLAAFDMQVITYDPHLSDADASQLGVKRV